MVEYGILVLVPTFVAIILAVVTRRLLTSLCIGLYVGGLIGAGGNPISAIGLSVSWMITGLYDIFHVQMLLFGLLIGGLIGLTYASGAHEKIGEWFVRHVKSKKKMEGSVFGLGLLFSFDDLMNTAFVGEAFREVSEKFKICKEKLSYILDSTAIPVTRLMPISTFAAFIVVTIAGVAAIEADPFQLYLSSIPMAFYAIFALILVGILIVSRRDYGPMLKAEDRVEKTGELSRKGSHPMLETEKIVTKVKDAPKRAINFVLPIVILVVASIISMLYTGGFLTGEVSIMNAFLYSDFVGSLMYGTIASIFSLLLLFTIEGWVNIKAWENMIFDGIKVFILPLIIIILAWGLVEMNGGLGTASYIADSVTGLEIAWAIPVAIFASSVLISFGTGTSWGTVALLIPIMLPLCSAVGVQLPLGLAAIVSGAAMGDHCSPISDSTILSSSFSGADHIDHFSTQMPYAVTIGVAAAFSFLLMGIGMPWIVTLVAGFVLLVSLVYILSSYARRKYRVKTWD